MAGERETNTCRPYHSIHMRLTNSKFYRKYQNAFHLFTAYLFCLFISVVPAIQRSACISRFLLSMCLYSALANMQYITCVAVDV